MSRLELHSSVQLTWAIANAEACRSGSSAIEPNHFLLALLKILDELFHDEAKQLGITAGEIAELSALIHEGRRFLGLPVEEITRLRRSVQRFLRQTEESVTIKLLHRSPSSREMFRRAAALAAREQATSLTFHHLLRTVLSNPPADVAAFISKIPVQHAAATQDAGGPERQRVCSQDEAMRQGSAIESLGRDLTSLAREGRLTAVVGRDKEIRTLARYLQRTSKRNVIVIGDPGVGKTAVVEGLAQRMASQQAPDFLKRLRIVQVNVADLVAGAKYRGDTEERVQRLLAEAKSDPNLVLFLDEIHLVIRSGSAGEGGMDIANIMKPALARDDIRCIGATTTEDFERYLQRDAAFMRRFQVLRVNEPSEEEAIRICREWGCRIEGIQDVVFSDDAILAAVSLSSSLIRGRSLPDKAIDLLENAAAFAKVSSLTFRRGAPTKERPQIDRSQIETVLGEHYGISVRAGDVLDTEIIGASLRNEIVGQDEAITVLLESLASLGRRKEPSSRPLAVFLFTGPTGVGKTFVAECLARALFGPDRGLGRFNMSELKERHELARLIGAPPGYRGFEEGGSLFRFVEAHPQGLVLLDEMEKAHPEIQDYFLQVFDKGEATNSHGRKADFRRQVFVMTANVISEAASKSHIGFRADEKSSPTRFIDKALNRYFRREFLGRIDRIIEFRHLGADDYQDLFERRLVELAGEMKEHFGVSLELTERARHELPAVCASQEEGVRGFIRLFEGLLVEPLFIDVKKGRKRSVIHVGWEENRVVFS